MGAGSSETDDCCSGTGEGFNSVSCMFSVDFFLFYCPEVEQVSITTCSRHVGIVQYSKNGRLVVD